MMSATVNENLNPFIKGDRVKVNDKTLPIFNRKGKVIRTIETSTEVLLDGDITVIINFTKLKKLKLKKKE